MNDNTNPYTGKPFSATCNFIQTRAQALPITRDIDRLLTVINDNQVTIIQGDTGTGKSTQIPRCALEKFSTFLGEKCIGLTQPRRLAAHEDSDYNTIQTSFHN